MSGSPAACPCGSGLHYTECCGPWHAGQPAPTAEALMRSRYSAYVLALEPYLLATWHPRTRPGSLNLAATSSKTKWLGLKLLRHERTGELSARVEFVARYREGGGGAVRLHEIGRFLCEDGRWYYLEGEFPE